MFRFRTMALFRVSAAVAAFAVMLRANRNGSPRDELIAVAIYSGVVLWFAFSHCRREAKKAMMPEEGALEKHTE